MDTNIRTLLTYATKYTNKKGFVSLKEAYELLRNVAENQATADAPEAFGQDLYVICAETAFQHGKADMAKECLKMYFMKTPPSNQFLCRAYLCQAQLLAPQTADNPEQLEKSVVYLLKAITMAKEHSKYHFLVYNASVLYWQFCRPFLKLFYRQYLARSLHQVVKALDDIDDKDYEWRAQLMIALIECHMDAGRKTDAANVASAAASFIRQNVPNLYKTVFGLLVKHQLVDAAKFSKEIKSSSELNVYFKICKLKLAIEQSDPEVDILQDMKKILVQLGGPEEAKPVPPAREKSEVKGRKSAASGDERKKKLVSDPSLAVPFLLLELGRLALDQGYPELSQQSLDLIRGSTVADAGFFVEVEFLHSELMVRLLKDKQESYNKSSVEVRLQAIKRTDEALQNAVRHGNPNVIQVGCVTQWNLCLPLLQANLRQHVRRPLTNVAEALENIHSLLIQLRCQVHTELAKCEEDQEQIVVAMEHLKKALGLDDHEVYKERLDAALHRLELRAELYQQPDRLEDQAAMIIEQARKADSGTVRMKRSLLVRAGQALAPDAFTLVLDSESDTKEVSAGKGPLTQIKKLAGKARQWHKGVRKAPGHLKRLGDENDKERAQLWGDLAKVARKQEVWDVCRTATRFCLLYDDDRWKVEPPKRDTLSPKLKRSRAEASSVSLSGEDRSDSDVTKERTKKDKEIKEEPTEPMAPEKGPPLYDKDLVRMMAEVHFINAEASIHLLRSEGVELLDIPPPPLDTSKRPKGYVATKPEDDPDWTEYCDWIRGLSQDTLSSFTRAVALGHDLDESWIVVSAASYMWNYSNHLLSQNRHREVVDTFQTILDGLQKVGHAGETTILVNICNGLATGLVQPWLPAPTPQEPEPAAKEPNKSPSASPRRGKPAPAANASKVKASVLTVTISPDAQPDLKRAVEVCEYAMKVSNGSQALDVVAIAVRHPLLQTWVRSKQMMQSQISRGFATDDEASMEGQDAMTRAMVAVEMLGLQSNGIMEFKETPSLKGAVEMLEACVWTDKLVELQLWTRLSFMSYQAKDYSLVTHCSSKALAFTATGTAGRGKKQEGHKYMVEQEMLSYSASLYGQSLVATTQGKNSIRRQAMNQFLDSAHFGKNAGNAEMVMTAARHYWNACLPLINQPIERELLKEPLLSLLSYINSTMDKNAYIKKTDQDDEKDSTVVDAGIPAVQPDSKTGTPRDTADSTAATQKTSTGIIGGPDDDLTLRASLYGVLFQSFADKGEWEAGLKAMDKAISDMPRTNHRLLIFRHLVMVKARLGKDVTMSIQKFKDESEDYVAHMWRRVALCSKEQLEQLLAYQNAIEALTSVSTEWQKVDYLLELGQWLYCNEFPLADAVDQIEWAVDIMLNMKFEAENKKDGKGRKGRKKGSAGPPARRSKSDKKARKSPEPIQKTPEVKASDISDSENEMNVADIIPVKKEIIIGVLPGNPNLVMSDLTDIRQLEGMFRSHTLLAQMFGRSSPHHSDYCLQAYVYIIRIWQISLKEAGPVMKEIAKMAPPEPTSTSKRSAAKKKEEKPKEKPKRKGPLDGVPQTTEEWATYDAPDEVIEAFKHETMKTTGVNQQTLSKPSLTMFYLDVLVSQLRDLGYNHLTLPVLAMADMLARDCLKSDALVGSIHLQALEVCTELNLQNGANFHEKKAHFGIHEEDQARSREEVALWKEKQIQVAKEEQRLKESLSKYKKDTERPERQLTQLEIEMQDKMKGSVTVAHIGKEMGNAQLRDIWTDLADHLLAQGMYQPARNLLNEAYQVAQAFEDNPLIGRIYFLLGKLSFFEAQYGQSVGFCKQAQEAYNGDEMFWYHSTALMVEATLRDITTQHRFKKARGILVHALNIFGDIAEMRPNKASITGFILAMLEAKLGSVQAKIAFVESEDIMKTKIINALDSACKKLQRGAEQLVKLGYRRESVSIMKEHAGILQKLAQVNTDIQQKHSYYLKAMDILDEAAVLIQTVYSDVQTLSSLQEMRNVNSPVQRELADIRLHGCELKLEVLEVHVKEERNQQLKEQRKGSVVKLVEDFTRETPDYTLLEKEWIAAISVLAETIVLEVTNAHSLAGNISSLKTKSLYQIGRCFRLLSQNSSPDAPQHWDVRDMGILKMTQAAASKDSDQAESEGGVTDRSGGLTDRSDQSEQQIHTTSKSYSKYSDAITRLKDELGSSHHYLVQAAECLTQALNISLQKGYKSVAGAAALELVECLGQFDPNMASQFLALHQSCAASEYLESLVYKALYDPTLSQPAALLHQRNNMMSHDVTSNASHGPVFKSVLGSLQQSQAWQRLGVSSHHLELMKEFPQNFNLVILQHSPDRSCLYGAIMDKPKPSGGGGGKQKQAAPQGGTKAQVVRIETSPQKLEQLLSRYRTYKQEVMTFLLKLEYKRSQQAQRQKMLENLDEQLQPGTKDPLSEDTESEEIKMHEQFLALLQDVEEYLRPITMQLEAFLRPPSATTMSNGHHREKDKDKEPPAPQEYVVLLADHYLMELPLEALAVFQMESIVSLSREVSLQMLYHKIHVEPLDEAAEKAKKEKDKNAPPSRIPGLRDAAKKLSKIIPLDRPIPPGFMPIDTHAFRYFIDPYLDCAETELHKPLEVFPKILEEHEQQFTPRWLGVTGQEHTPSPGEYEIYALESSAVLFYGMERFLSYLPSHKVAALNIPDCQLVMLFDLSQTSKSFLRQSKTDVLKTADMLSLEKPVESSLLLGLTGARCVISNQWHCTLQENAEKIQVFMRDVLAKGLTTGQTVRMLFTPYRRKSEEEAVDKTKEEEEKKAEGSVEEQEEPEPEPEPQMTREWFNMVCYGLPNLLVTQLGKA